MKKTVSLLLTLAVCMSVLCTPALAIKGQVVDLEELPYVMNDSEPSSWATSEITAAQKAGLIPALTGEPGYQDSITREQFA